MGEIAGYVLRIASDRWVDHVFTMALYHTGLRRRWKQGQTVIFIHKTEVGDAVVGYGVIDRVCEQNELSEEEKLEGEAWGKAIVFNYVIRFEKPLPVRETFMKEQKYRGRYAHGLQLSKEQLDSVLNQAELSSHQRTQSLKTFHS